MLDSDTAAVTDVAVEVSNLVATTGTRADDHQQDNTQSRHGIHPAWESGHAILQVRDGSTDMVSVADRAGNGAGHASPPVYVCAMQGVLAC